MIGGAFPDRSHRRLIDFGVGAFQQNFVVHQSLRDPVRPRSVNARPSPLSPCQKEGAYSARGADGSQAPSATERPPIEARRRREGAAPGFWGGSTPTPLCT